MRFTLSSQHDNLTADIEGIVLPFICEELAEPPSDISFLPAMAVEEKHLADEVVYPGNIQEPGVIVLIGSDQV